MKIRLEDLMTRSGVTFGTSGARGLAAAMSDLVCYAYTRAFLQYLQAAGEQEPGRGAVAVAGDLRPSTARILEAVSRAVEETGARAIACGRIPSPAVALYGLEQRIPAIMVTGSHIPDDRNGIKFNKASGEILKQDERGIAAQTVDVDEAMFDAAGAFRSPRSVLRAESSDAAEGYVARYLDFVGRGALKGLRVGVYQHSAVGRDLLVRVLSSLGAETVPRGRSDTFIPVDTEAIRPEDVEHARAWTREDRLDAIVSTDGDSDRPLVSDEEGRWLRGDVAGILCARSLEADVVCTPVSCNTAVEQCGWFKAVHRTRIGSPYVIAAMSAAAAAGANRVVGYEANGGFLVHSNLEQDGRRLRALPTRDAMIVILSLLRLGRRQGKRISELVSGLPSRSTASDRLRDFPTERSRAILARFDSGSEAADRAAIEALLGDVSGPVKSIDRTDGLRVLFANGEILHFRPSGNAPELRCYSEADTDDRARALTAHALGRLGAMR
ncbi:MAG TPA: phosphomannomutase [Verrucomicrobiota bacterium]|nr:phosphomannomutase [Verrucomicrobiota bacterium]HNU49467.1 phosphomannomutase [Verrucomicrobiota bacterium]